MMSRPARSMSRIAVSAASSNISSRSPGPYWPASYALTVANHHPGLPWEPTTLDGISGSSAIDDVSFEKCSRSRRYCTPEGVSSADLGCMRAVRRASGGAADHAHDRTVAVHILRPADEDDLAALDDVEARGELWYVVDVGLRDQDRAAERGDRGKALADRGHDRRRQAFERLVEQQHIGVEGQRPCDGQHLALAAAHLGALARHVAPERREDAIRLLDSLRGRAVRRAGPGRDFDVLRHREAGEDPAVLGCEAQSHPRDLEAPCRLNLPAAEGDVAG